MKTRTILITFIFFACSIVLTGQDYNHTGKFNIGIEGGIQFTNLSNFFDSYTQKSKIGFTTGLFGEYNLTNKLSLRLGLNYDQRAFELYRYNRLLADTKGNSYYIYQVDYYLNYLTIPITISYSAGSEKFKVFVKGGFYLSFLLNASRNGIEDYYIDGEGDLDISGTILHYGKNEFIHNGSTNGFAEVDINSENNQPEKPNYYEINFMPSDLGFNMSLGLLYQPTPSIGLTIGPGFLISFSRVFVDLQSDYKWQQIVKLNLGFIYTINSNKKPNHN